MEPGIFISIEGIDGAGKSTHIERIAALFRSRGREVVLTREPGGTPLAEKIRTLLLNERMDGLSEALLMFASRREHILDVVAPALARGVVVISDRFTDSSFAYQGGGRHFDVERLRTLERWVQEVHRDGLGLTQVTPDLTLWFDLPAEIAAQRLSTARTPDKFESESLVFFQNVIKAYQSRQREYPERIMRIDAHQTVEAVWADVLACLRGRGWGPAE